MNTLKRRWRDYGKVLDGKAEPSVRLAFWRDVANSGQFSAGELGFLYESLESHPKHRGVFYTPADMADYLTRRTLGERLEGTRRDIERALNEGKIAQAQEHLDAVLALRVLDPACGCGVFLQSALTAFSGFYRSLNDKRLQRPGDIERHILTRQLYGVDIDPVAVMLANTLLGDGVAHVVCGNALVDNDTETPEFSWSGTFQDVRHWDVVLGNPPYISEVRGQKGMFRQLQQASCMPAAYSSKMDLCDWFVMLAMEKLAPGGQLGLVLPEYWMQRSASAGVRQAVMRDGVLKEIWTFGEAAMFARAQGHHSSLLIWEKETPRPTAETVSFQMGCGMPLSAGRLKPAAGWLPEASAPLLIGQPKELAILETMACSAGRIAAENIQQGIVIPQGTLNAANWKALSENIQKQYPVGSGIFILTDDEIEALNLNETERKLLRPYYAVGDFKARRGFLSPLTTSWILYVGAHEKNVIEKNRDRYPNLTRHLDRFSTINTSSHAPYGLHRARQARWFESDRKILGLRQTLKPTFAVVPHPAYVGEGFYIIDTPTPWTPEALCGILNSLPAWFWFFKHKRKGLRLQVDKDVLCTLPLPDRLPESDGDEAVCAAYGLRPSDYQWLSESFSAALTPL